jgi:hypothetical protein
MNSAHPHLFTRGSPAGGSQSSAVHYTRALQIHQSGQRRSCGDREEWEGNEPSGIAKHAAATGAARGKDSKNQQTYGPRIGLKATQIVNRTIESRTSLSSMTPRRVTLIPTFLALLLLGGSPGKPSRKIDGAKKEGPV